MLVLSVIRLIRGLCMTDRVYDKGGLGIAHNGIFNLRLDGIPRCAFHPAAAPRAAMSGARPREGSARGTEMTRER